MNKKFKFLTVLLALVMTLSAFAPFSARAEEEKKEEKTEETTKTVTLHKILMDKKAFSNFTAGTTGKDGKEYDGNEITDIKGFFADTKAEEIGGVYFVLKDKDGNYIKAKTAEDFNDEEKLYSEEQKAELLKKFKLTPKFDENGNVVTTTEIDEAVGGLTTDNGLVFYTEGLKGEFKIDEIHDKSTYKGTTTITDKNGKTTEVNTQLTDMKAVPVNITLPLVNNNGVVVNAHVYPKNTEDIPKIDKNFAEDSDLTKAEDGTPVNKGANYENYEMEKDTANAKVGLEVKYQVKTEIPAKSHLQEAHWDDRMTEGLTFKQDSLKIKVDGTELNPEDYELDVREDGFDLRLTEKGLEKVNGKDAAVTVELKYSAIVNEKAKVDIPDSNDVTFHYGHKKSNGNTPVPTNPKDGKIKVVKSWADGVADADKIELSVQLYNANTGKKVGEVQKLNEDNNWSYEWTGLDEKYQYKVVEIYSGFEAEYNVGEVGTITIKNHKSDNPKPLNPTEPKVVTGGKKFVKTNQDGNERLAGAEFYVKNEKNEYLVAAKKDASKVTAAKKALDEAVKAYNNLTAEEQEGTKGEELKNTINTAQEAYNKAFKENAIKYTWGDKGDANVVVLTSDAEGRFEIAGLEYGSYKLEEKTPPAGFAKLNGDVEFVVKKDSYNGQPEGVNHKHIGYNSDTDTIKGQQIENKKVSIPQTGGIGTVIFTVVGVMLMVGAAFALKRRKEDELEGLA